MKRFGVFFGNNENRKRLLYTEIVIFFLCFMFCVFAPFEIYLSSKEEFFFEGYELISFFILCFGTLFIALSFLNIVCMLLAFRGRILHNFYFSCLFSIGLAFYIQGNYIVVDYGVLDGNAINWQDYQLEGLVSHGVFVVFFILGIILLKKIEILKYMRIGSAVSGCIMLVQILTLSVLMLSSGGLGKEPVYVSTTEGEFSYSSNENMFVLLLDTFDAQVMNDLLASEDAEICKEVLGDFTYYPDTTSTYSNTYFSVPHIVSGEKATDDMTYDDYIETAYELADNEFYRELDHRGWKCRMYTDTQLPDVDEEVVFENLNKHILTVSSHRRLGAYMIKLIGFRYMPQCLKEYFWFYSDDMKSMISIESESDEIFYWGNTEFYEGIDSINLSDEKGVFAFYHLEGTHLPFHTTRDMVRTEEEVGINEEGLAMMNMLDKFFSKLREMGIYDDSIIVVMADHGHYEYHENPVFMVKGKGEKHDFITNGNGFTYDDMQNVWCNLLDGLPADEAVICHEDADRIFYEVDKDELSEMIVTEDLNDTQFTGQVITVE